MLYVCLVRVEGRGFWVVFWGWYRCWIDLGFGTFGFIIFSRLGYIIGEDVLIVYVI